MGLIAANTRIHAQPTVVLDALTTSAGVRRWWTDEAEMGRDIGAPIVLRFGAIEVTFLIDRIDRHGIEMTCVAHKNCAEWIDTHLAFRVIPEGDGVFVDVLHDGYRDRDGHCAQWTERWTDCLQNLRTYCETGRGTPRLTSA